MKFRILVLALVTALVGASVALAHDNPGKGKPETRASKPKPTTGPNCKPRVKVVLKGTLANDPATGDTSLQMTATKSNRHGRAFVLALQPITINVDAKTKVRRKADLKDGGTPDLTARHIKAKPAAPAPPPPPAPAP